MYNYKNETFTIDTVNKTMTVFVEGEELVVNSKDTIIAVLIEGVKGNTLGTVEVETE